jgi:hypothetical protein
LARLLADNLSGFGRIAQAAAHGGGLDYPLAAAL